MKSNILFGCVLALVAQFISTSAFASSGSISGTVSVLSGTINGLTFPVAGKLGNLTFNKLVLLPKLKLPLLDGGIPVIGSIDIQSYLQTVQAVGVFQKPLAGLGVLNGTVSKVISKIP